VNDIENFLAKSEITLSVPLFAGCTSATALATSI
jgi:hypothetical protein